MVASLIEVLSSDIMLVILLQSGFWDSLNQEDPEYCQNPSGVQSSPVEGYVGVGLVVISKVKP